MAEMDKACSTTKMLSLPEDILFYIESPVWFALLIVLESFDWGEILHCAPSHQFE